VVKTKRPSETRVQGAVQSQSSWRHKLDAWSAHHSNSAIDSLLRLLESPFQTLVTWLVIAIAVTLPSAVFWIFIQVQQVSFAWQDTNRLSVFLQKNTHTKQAEEFRARWAQNPKVAEAIYISPEQGLVEFKQESGLAGLVDHLDNNPLPAVVIIKPKLDSQTPKILEALQQALKADPLVEEVSLDLQWVKRLHQFIDLAKRIVFGLSALMALGVLLVISHTVRMAIDQRRDEILVVKLVGATDAYVRRPFLYTGLWYGLGGGLLAVLLLLMGFYGLSQPVADLAVLYQSQFRLEGLGLIGSLGLILLTGLIGLIGAWLAVARHLYLIQPR
jgi:cell division transport system permease protein